MNLIRSARIALLTLLFAHPTIRSMDPITQCCCNCQIACYAFTMGFLSGGLYGRAGAINAMRDNDPEIVALIQQPSAPTPSNSNANARQSAPQLPPESTIAPQRTPESIPLIAQSTPSSSE